jgi:uncharacterized protein
LKEKFNLLAVIIDSGNSDISGTSLDVMIEPGEIDLEGEALRLKTPVKIEAELKKGIVETNIAGTISARVSVECTRCLTEIEHVLEFPFEASFVSPEYFTEAKEIELRESELDVDVVQDGNIDLAELVREQILLNLPEQIFCREDCRGLCEKCGANLNLIDCNCKEKEIDPRWAALKDLK